MTDFKLMRDKEMRVNFLHRISLLKTFTHIELKRELRKQYSESRYLCCLKMPTKRFLDIVVVQTDELDR